MKPSRVVGIGCFGRLSTFSRVLDKILEDYSLGPVNAAGTTKQANPGVEQCLVFPIARGIERQQRAQSQYCLSGTAGSASDYSNRFQSPYGGIMPGGTVIPEHDGRVFHSPDDRMANLWTGTRITGFCVSLVDNGPRLSVFLRRSWSGEKPGRCCWSLATPIPNRELRRSRLSLSVARTAAKKIAD